MGKYRVGMFMLVWALVVLFYPWEALAALCWQDQDGNQYSLELGPGKGSKIPIFGYRTATTGCCTAEGCVPGTQGILPLTGTAVVLNSRVAVFGAEVFNHDPHEPRCFSFIINLQVDLQTLRMTGSARGDDGFVTDLTLTPSVCPGPD